MDNAPSLSVTQLVHRTRSWQKLLTRVFNDVLYVIFPSTDLSDYNSKKQMAAIRFYLPDISIGIANGCNSARLDVPKLLLVTLPVTIKGLFRTSR